MIGRWSRASLLIVGAALAAGCLGEPTPSVSAVATGFPVASVPSAAPSQGAAPSGPALPAPPIAFTELTCGDPDDVIPIGELQGPGGAESGLDPDAAVLRTFLEGAGGLGYPFPPRAGTASRASARRPASLRPVRTAGCRWSSNRSTARSRPPTTVHVSSLHAWRTASRCYAGGWTHRRHRRLPGTLRSRPSRSSSPAPTGSARPDAELPPIVTSDARSVVVTLVVRRLDSADCPGNPTFPLTIGLPEPLGARQLLDGSTFPAAPPSEP